MERDCSDYFMVVHASLSGESEENTKASVSVAGCRSQEMPQNWLAPCGNS
jgi:hypothetical protein